MSLPKKREIPIFSKNDENKYIMVNLLSCVSVIQTSTAERCGLILWGNMPLIEDLDLR